MSNRLGFSNRVRYAVLHDKWGFTEISEPRNWNEDKKEFARNMKNENAGIITKLSTSVEFTGLGRDTIRAIYRSYGANTDLRLIKEAKDPDTDVWYRVWDGQLDLTTYKNKDSITSVNFNADSLETIVKSRQSEKYELDRDTDLFGNELDPVNIESMLLDGRKILLESLLNVKDTDANNSRVERQSRNGGTKFSSATIPLQVDYESDFNISSPLKNQYEYSDTEGDSFLLFYVDNDIDKKLNINIDGTMLAQILRIEDVSQAYFAIMMTVYENGTDLDVKSREVLYEDFDVYGMHNREISFSETYTVDLLQGESIALHYYTRANYPDWTNFRDGEIKLEFHNVDVRVSISEDSFFESSHSNFIFPHEAMGRLMRIITGRDNAFYSEALGRTDIGYIDDGIDTGALCGLSTGMWKRGFVKGDDLYYPITTSIKEFMESYSAVWGLSMGTEKIGFQERLRIEPKSYFYNRNVTIRLGKEVDGKFVYDQVNNHEVKFNADEYFSEIVVGSQKAEAYEEIQGLDEFNLQSSFSTVINKIAKTLNLLSPYNRDATGGEIARRKPKASYPTEDTKYDNYIYMEDMKRGTTDVFIQRKWQDDFPTPPTGIFDVTSATNLRLSQVRMLLRSGFQIAQSVIKYPTEFIRFTSNKGNANLFTKTADEEVGYSEGGDIPNSDLDRAIHEPEYLEFEYKVSDKLLAEIDGQSTILGKTFPTKYGLVEYLDDENQIQRGHIISVKPNGKGKWKLKKYYNLNQ